MTVNKNNPHKNMEIRNVWFKEGEYDNLINALDVNNKEEALNIIWKIYLRKDI